MIRIIVRTDNAGMAANVGGSVHTTFETFEVEHAGMEAALRHGLDYTHAQIIGAELIEPPLAPTTGK